jgi:predicted MPP superfamily phosphohydrolase
MQIFGSKFRKIRMIIVLMTVFIALAHIVHALTLDRIIQYKEISFHSANLASELCGYRIAFITDSHFISEKQTWEVVNELNKRNLDLVVLGGDFAWEVDVMQKTVEVLSNIEATDGIYGVEGNHDSYVHLFMAMEANGIVPLSNNGVHIRERLFLAGVEDLWNRSPYCGLLYLIYRVCSWKRSFRLRLVWPTYARLQVLQVRLYIPLLL